MDVALTQPCYSTFTLLAFSTTPLDTLSVVLHNSHSEGSKRSHGLIGCPSKVWSSDSGLSHPQLIDSTQTSMKMLRSISTFFTVCG